MKVERILAPNPSVMTGPGTNTWVASSAGEAIVVDPGPIIPGHLKAIHRSLAGLEPRAVLVTHSHPDHAPAANGLADELGVPAIGSAAGPDFSPDRLVADGDAVEFGTLKVVTVATPGHTSDSTCYRVGDALFTGDHIMGGSTVIVEDMSDYLSSLRILGGTGLAVIYPGHGPVIAEPDAVISDYVTHRLEREAQVLASVRAGARTVGQVVESVYAEVHPSLHPAAALSVAAHLRKLDSDGEVRFSASDDTWSATVEVA
jgi:glyoxylase-like metal-dependent hydrolase (beta-lactamase superfamily II)